MASRPKGINLTRGEIYDEHDLPDLMDGEYLHEFFEEIGFCAQGYSSAIGLLWQEIKAWNECWNGICEGWDLDALHIMSRNYANQFNISNNEDMEAPYLSDEAESREEDAKEERLDRCRNIFESYIKE